MVPNLDKHVARHSYISIIAVFGNMYYSSVGPGFVIGAPSHAALFIMTQSDTEYPRWSVLSYHRK